MIWPSTEQTENSLDVDHEPSLGDNSASKKHDIIQVSDCRCGTRPQGGDKPPLRHHEHAAELKNDGVSEVVSFVVGFLSTTLQR